MKRLLIVMLGTLTTVMSFTSPAYASLSDWLDKMEKLSGPGPFRKWLGASVDIICVEGQWWRNPGTLTTPADPVEWTRDPGKRTSAQEWITFEQSILTALGDWVNNPFRMARLIELLSEPAPQYTARDADRLRSFVARFQDAREPALRALRHHLRAVLWRLREEMLASKGRESPQSVLARFAIQDTEKDLGRLGDTIRQAFTDSVRVTTNIGCVGDLRKSRLNFGVSAAWFSTETLPTGPSSGEDDVYTYPPAIALRSPVVNAYPIALTVERSLPFVSDAHPIVLRSLDLGASFGAIYFDAGGDQGRFSSFWSGPYIEFPRLTWRPLGFVACKPEGRCPGNWTTWDLFEVELVGKSIPSVEPQDFGANAGPPSGRHFQWWLRVGISIKFNRDQTPDVLRR
jgi:hypothetical protein